MRNILLYLQLNEDVLDWAIRDDQAQFQSAVAEHFLVLNDCDRL